MNCPLSTWRRRCLRRHLDLPRVSTSEAAAATTSINGPSPSPSEPGGLSTGAKAAIGVVVPIVVIAAFLGAFFFLRRRRQRRLDSAPKELPASLSSSQSPVQASGGYGLVPLQQPQELQGLEPPVELLADEPQHMGPSPLTTNYYSETSPQTVHASAASPEGDEALSSGPSPPPGQELPHP
ncbi:Transmembrane alpha-helix domain-containing protein [Tolypocladium paradoxum]|uniref:Transmembrane alpha-helix domain-containing protein n=1 Tax=Tolypocladium paradoxum TaxID=94208 RepID=A0A2S4KWY1_9HYPO|nr:Transmembrane alpha-helix domain-containing protein [Tolypocladium paradoxum]